MKECQVVRVQHGNKQTVVWWDVGHARVPRDVYGILGILPEADQARRGQRAHHRVAGRVQPEPVAAPGGPRAPHQVRQYPHTRKPRAVQDTDSTPIAHGIAAPPARKRAKKTTRPRAHLFFWAEGAARVPYISRMMDYAAWNQDAARAQLLWSAHAGEKDTLERPYQDLHAAAQGLRARFRELYDSSGSGYCMGVNRNKVNGSGHVLNDEDRLSVEQALDHLGARRIWSARAAAANCMDKNDTARPGSVAALLRRFPRLQDSLSEVAKVWLEPGCARAGLVVERRDAAPALPAALQLRLGAVDQADEDEFMDYFDFVHAVSRRWLAGALLGQYHPLAFDAIQEHAHQSQGGRAASDIQYARRLVDAQLLQVVRMDAEGEDIVLPWPFHRISIYAWRSPPAPPRIHRGLLNRKAGRTPCTSSCRPRAARASRSSRT